MKIIPEKIFEAGKKQQALIIIAAGLFARLLLTTLFLNKYGPHATRGELWHWVAAAEGKALLNPLDPTKLLFDVTRLFFGGDAFFYGLMLLAIISSSLLGVIIYLLVAEIYDKRTAFISGLIYVLMTEPLYSSVANFIHDLVVLPLVLLSVLSFVLFAKKSLGLKQRVLCLFSIFFFGWLAFNASREVYVLIGLFALFFSYYSFNLISDKLGVNRDKSYPFFVFGIVLISLLLTAFIGNKVFDEIFGLMSQGRYGSIDIVPLSLEAFWGRTNLFVFLLPAGLFAAFRKKDNLFLALFFFGLLISAFVSRGTRIMDIGAAVIVAHALVSWKKSWLVPSIAIYSVFLFAVLFSTVFDFDYFLFSYLPSIILTACFVLLYIKYKNENYFVPLFIIAGLFMGYVACVEKVPVHEISSEGEYLSLKWLSSQVKPGDKVLIAWDRGDMAWAVAGIEPISNFDRISMRAHNMLWHPEDRAALELKKYGVTYVVITTRDFSSFMSGGGIQFSLGSLIFEDKENLAVVPITNSTIYKLRYSPQTTTHFTPINVVLDSRSGVNVLIYKIEPVVITEDAAA